MIFNTHAGIRGEEGSGLIIHGGRILRTLRYKHPMPIQELLAEEGGGLIIHHGLIIRSIWYVPNPNSSHPIGPPTAYGC